MRTDELRTYQEAVGDALAKRAVAVAMADKVYAEGVALAKREYEKAVSERLHTEALDLASRTYEESVAPPVTEASSRPEPEAELAPEATPEAVVTDERPPVTRTPHARVPRVLDGTSDLVDAPRVLDVGKTVAEDGPITSEERHRIEQRKLQTGTPL